MVKNMNYLSQFSLVNMIISLHLTFMNNAIEIAYDIYWVGSFDKSYRAFDIDMDTKHGMTYNSYLVKTSKGNVLIDTCEDIFFDSYLQKLKKLVTDLSSIKYIIANHTEPDHSGSIERLIDFNPKLTVIASQIGLMNLSKIIHTDFNQISAEELGVLKFGGKSFEFISVPFLHWPDTMFTYMKKEKVLFTCDAFGSIYCPLYDIRISQLLSDEEKYYQAGLLQYYTNTFLPFKQHVINGIEKIENLEIDYICSGHGPVLDSRILETIEKYLAWSTSSQTLKSASKSILIVYCSAHGYTEQMAKTVELGIKGYDPNLNVKSYKVDVTNFIELKSKLIDEMLNVDGILFGSVTINGDAHPFIWELAIALNPFTHNGKIASVFGSYGWSGEGIENIVQRLVQVRLKVLDSLKVQFKPSRSDLKSTYEFGSRFAKSVKTGIVPEMKTISMKTSSVDYKKLNPSGKVVLWRCVVCGEIIPGVYPPSICPQCGIDQENFELYTPEDVKISSENYFIIGPASSGVAAAKAIREVVENANILIVANDHNVQQYSSLLSDEQMKIIDESEFFIKLPRFGALQQRRYERESKALKCQRYIKSPCKVRSNALNFQKFKKSKEILNFQFPLQIASKSVSPHYPSNEMNSRVANSNRLIFSRKKNFTSSSLHRSITPNIDQQKIMRKLSSRL